MNPLLSIIIPFYGHADKRLLERCLHSIDVQGVSADQYEVMVCDDEGRGLGGARNIGLLQAKGDYVLFVDADDILLADGLKPCLDLLNQYHPDMLTFGFERFAGDELPIQKRSKTSFQVSESGSAYLAKHNFTGTAWHHLFKRDWLITQQLTFAENRIGRAHV